MPRLSYADERVADVKVRSARKQIDQALEKMSKILDEVESQANKVKEELGEPRTDG